MGRTDFEEWSCKKRAEEEYKLGRRDLRRWYQRDIDQITHSTCFRKLQRKSQLLSEKDPRSRSRLIHTIEVSRIALEVSEKLGLSKELTEAICLAHDIGTSPYGCVGNSFLQARAEDTFSHELAGAYMLLMIAQKETSEEEYQNKIEAQVADAGFCGSAIIEIDEFPNTLCASRICDKGGDKQYFVHHISPEILDGVYEHGASGLPSTLEGQVVRFADNIAYLSQDIEDLITTGLLDKRAFTKHTADKELQYVREPSSCNPIIKHILTWNEADNKPGAPGTASRETCRRRIASFVAGLASQKHTMTWAEIDQDPGLGSLEDAFSESRGRRIAAFVTRFVRYNTEKLNGKDLKFRYSKILKKNIPVLEYDAGADFVIQYIWNFIEAYYNSPLIVTSSKLQIEKMTQLWEIINTPGFQSNNASYRSFMDMASNNSFFHKYSTAWKTAFFISHLSWFDVDLIIDSYHERNNTFELDISY